jgi:hypothetical protein
MAPKVSHSHRSSAHASGGQTATQGRPKQSFPPASALKSSRTCCITGASGCFASYINGTYTASSDTSSGYPIYVREQACTTSGLFIEMCIEFAGGNWEIKNALCRGTRRCFARIQQDGPLESVAFLDTWMISTGDGSKLASFEPQPEICLRFSGDKRMLQRGAAAGIKEPDAACVAAGPSSPHAPSHSTSAHDGHGSDCESGDEEPFSKVLYDFFEVFECGSNGQMDTSLVAPTLQALELEEHVHVVCGCMQQYAQPRGAGALLFFLHYIALLFFLHSLAFIVQILIIFQMWKRRLSLLERTWSNHALQQHHAPQHTRHHATPEKFGYRAASLADQPANCCKCRRGRSSANMAGKTEIGFI